MSGPRRPALARPLSYSMIALCGVILVHAVFYYVSLSLFHGRVAGVEDWVFALGATYARWFPWFFALPLVVWIAKHYMLDGPHLGRNVLIHLAAMIAVSMLVVLAGLAAIYLGIRVGRMPDAFADRLAFLASFELPTNMTLYITTVVLVHVSAYYRKARDRELATLALETQLLRAQLEALRSQLNPHFLFNALNSVAELIATDARTAERMVLALASFLRRLVESNWTQVTTLRAELALLGDYLEIARCTYGARMQVEIDVPADLQDAPVPHMSLQPLVENALKHGSGGGTRPVAVRIAARRSGARLALTVRDDGPGPAAGAVAPGCRSGLVNLRERLSGIYGADQRFGLFAAPGGGCEATLDLPLGPSTADDS